MESITDYWDIEKCATLKGLHLEVLTNGSNDFVFLPDPGFQREKMSRCERLLLVEGLIFFHEMARFPGRYIDESRLAITPS